MSLLKLMLILDHFLFNIFCLKQEINKKLVKQLITFVEALHFDALCLYNIYATLILDQGL